MPPRTAARRTPFLLLTALVPVLLTGCGSSAASGGEVVVTVTPSPSASTAPAPATSRPPLSASPSVTAPAAPSTLHAPLASPSPTKEKPSCGPDSVQAAAAKAASTLPVDADMQDPWTTSNMDEQGYDACSPLSWIVLGTGGASRFAPRTVALFHYGKLMRSAGPTDPLPEVKRLDDRSIQITWRSPRDSSETNYEDFSLVATSVYSWDEDAGKITRTGSLPPHS